MVFDTIRDRFPGLQRQVHGKDLIYLDSANTAQKIDAAIVASDEYYRRYTANVFRAVHALGEEATAAFEAARDSVRDLLNAADRAEIIFTRGTTEAINLVSYSFGELLKAGDAIVLTQMEHHANIVPWQLLAQRRGIELRVVPLSHDAGLDLDALDRLLDARVKLLAFTHVSNVIGRINPAQQLCQMARARGIATLLDGSQAVPHQAVDVQALGCDFYVFTGHKLFAPTGTGVLYGKREWLERMPPFLGGGEMIENVSFEKTSFAGLPNKFEAGTPNIAGVIGLGAAIRAVRAIGFAAIHAREAELQRYADAALRKVPGLRLLGREAHLALENFAPVFSFVVEGTHPHDLAMLIDQDGIAIRSGQHCAHPLMQALGAPASARASLCFYNRETEIDALVASIARARSMLA
jgi:cysteine desulfurase / selenocysteine lyase